MRAYMGVLKWPVETTEQARHIINFFIDFPTGFLSGKEGPMSSTGKMAEWYSTADTLKKEMIKQAIHAEIVGLSQNLQDNPAGLVLRKANHLAQIVEELKLDDNNRDNLLAVAQSSKPQTDGEKRSQVRLYAWLTVIQPKDGAWKEIWLKFWEVEDSAYWGVAFGGLTNIDPQKAALRIPKLLTRSEDIGKENVALALHDILQYPIDWQGIIKEWGIENTPQTQNPRLITEGIETIFREMYPDGIPPKAQEGLDSFELACGSI